MLFHRFPVEYQMGSQDRGPASPKIIAKHFGKYYSLQFPRDRCCITKEGVSLLAVEPTTNFNGSKAQKEQKRNSFSSILKHFQEIYQGNYRRLIMTRTCLTFLFFFSFFGVYTQTIEEIYDLEFKSFGKSYRGDWTNSGIHFRFSIDSTESIDGKNPLKITSIPINRGSKERSLNFSRTIVLPQYKKGDICSVSINSKSENFNDWRFYVKGLDENEQTVSFDSLLIDNKAWKVHSMSFPLYKEKAVRIMIRFSDKTPENDQYAWIDKIKIYINGRSINEDNLNYMSNETSLKLNEKHIIPLSLSNNNVVSEIPDIRNKKIIGLGECTHGSLEIKNACYQFIRALVSEENCNIIILERAPDMCLKWDLYINGIGTEELENEIKQELGCIFDDSVLFLDFLKWLRNYNKVSKTKVRIFGVNTLANPELFLFDYFRLLLPDTYSLPYLRLLQDNKYKEISKLISSDTNIQSVINKTDIHYLQFLLKEFDISSTIFASKSDNREINMWRRMDKILQLYSKPFWKAVLYAHSSHTNNESDFFYDVDRKPSLGYFIFQKYKNDYFSIGFQVGNGEYTQDESGFFSKTIKDQLQTPYITSFEYSALKSKIPYFYYPTTQLPKDISSIRAVGRERKKTNQFFFCSLKTRFNG